MSVKIPVSLLPWWSSLPLPPRGWLGRWSRGMRSLGGVLAPDLGYKIYRTVTTIAANKGGASFIHRHTDGTESVIYWYNGTLLYDDGDSSPTSIATSLTDTFQPMWANMASPVGGSIFVNGTDAQAQWVREVSNVPVAVPITGSNGMNAPANPTVSAESGGTFPDGTYYVRIAYVDDNGATSIVTGPNATAQTVTLSGGNNKIRVVEPASPPARCTKIRIGVATADTPSSYLQEAQNALNRAGGNHDITSQTGTAQAFENRNGAYAYASWTDIGATNITGICLYEGRFFIWSDKSNDLWWSERDEPVWYATNAVDTGAEGGWNAPVVACAPTAGAIYVFTNVSIHRIAGTFIRDTDGTDPTYFPDIDPDTISVNFGAVSRNLTVIGGNIFFHSTQGPAVLRGNSVALPAQEHIREDVRRLWDWTYATRWGVAEDPDNGCVCFYVTRKTNSNRPPDGASTAGICDTIYRLDLGSGHWIAPLQLDCVHLTARTNGSLGGTTQLTYLMGMTPFGQAIQLNYGWSGGAAADVSGTNYDGQTASASTTTSADGTWTGLSANSEVGKTVTLFYPTGDTGYPAVLCQKMISSNDTDTLNWQGALTVPTGTNWTVRLGGLLRAVDFRGDLRDGVPEIPTDAKVILLATEVRYTDLIGLESRS